MKVNKILSILLLILFSLVLVGCNKLKDGDIIKVKTIDKSFEPKKIENESSYYKVIYVSPNGADTNDGSYNKPVKTLDGARYLATSLSPQMDKDICVVFREGFYKNSKTTFTSNDSGKNGHKIIYMGYPGEKAVISGGLRVSSWVKDGNLFYTNIKASTIRELFINGEKATLARNPNGVIYTQLANWNTDEKKAVAKKEDLLGATSFETVFYMEWAESIARVKSVKETSEGMKMTFKPSEQDIFYNRSYVAPPQGLPDMYVYYQNAMEFLDNPGEFYYDGEQERLYYYPRECDDLSTAEVIIPSQERIITIQGEVKKYVENIEFENLTFANNADYTVYKQGFSEIQASHYYSYVNGAFTTTCEVIGAAIELNFAQNINFNNSTFTCTSNGGILFDTYVNNCNVEGNLFYKTGAYGVLISADCSTQLGQSLFNMPNSDPICHDILVKNNYLFYTGTTFTRSPAITNIHGYNITISHNEIGYVSYSGISCGWGWSTKPYHARNNVIEANNIHHYGLFGSDLGGIYILNSQPDSIVTKNYIHECANTMMAYSAYSCINPIYLDEGTDYTEVSYNQIAYCNCGSMKVMYHITGDHITEIDTRGVEYGDELDMDIVKAAGVEDGKNSLRPYEINDSKMTTNYTLLGKKTNPANDIYGYRFDVEEPITIKALGRMYGVGNYQKHTITIYDSEKNAVCSATVDMFKGLPDQFGYKYAELKKSIKLEKGTYYIVSQEYEGGDWFSTEASRIISDKVKETGIVRTNNFRTIKSDGYGFVGLNMIIE